MSDSVSPSDARTMRNRFGAGLAAALALTLIVTPVLAQAVQQEAPTQQAPAATQTETEQQQPQSPAPVDAPAPQAAPEAVPQASDIDPGLAEAPAENTSTLPHDLSPWGMFMAADWVVKGVMGGLAFASLVTWTVWISKSLELAGARRRARKALHATLAARSLDEALQQTTSQKGAGAAMIRSAREEVKLSAPVLDHAVADGLKERVSSRLGRIEVHAGRRMSMGTGVLATIGSTSPFVGLFGTVWGIMNSFIGISQAQTTNLAVVAPGIAEALLATAIGLVAAIPAVVIYNVFARSIAAYRQLLADIVAGVERLVSRDLDFRALAGASEGRRARATQAAE